MPRVVLGPLAPLAPLAFLAHLAPLAPVAAQRPAPVQYEVSVAAPETHLFHVRATFPARLKDTLYVSLPAWSPGNYEIQNYARYVRHFGAKAASGQPLGWDRWRKDTWRVAAPRTERVSVEFEYFADTVDLSLARLLGSFGQVLGTNLFLYEDGHLDRPAEVRFALPAGWSVTTALPGTGTGPYTAANYHELADAQTFVGQYSLDSLEVDGKSLRIAVWPADAYSAGVRRNLRTDLERIAKTENALFGGPPYERYTVFFNVIREPINFGGGLEHAASQFDIMPQGGFANEAGELGDFMVPLMSHEYFHLFNVKRIRPVEMWPYEYHAEQYTPLLWWSEGVTDYYADLTNLRSHLWTTEQFLGNAAQNMQQVEAAPEPWSEEDGSVATWINEIFVNSSQLYYPKGSLTGLLLDTSIRDATDNRHGLDDVMRALYTRFYQRDRGFAEADLLGLFREFGMPDVAGFARRYIHGREPLPYEAVLAKAGIAVARQTMSSPFLGLNAQPDQGGKVVVQGVVPGSAADAAGLEPGDVLVKVGELEVHPEVDWGARFRERYRGQAGAPLPIAVTRAGRALTLSTQVRERTAVSFSVTPVAAPTEKQAKVWRALATGSTGY
ncbi:MAG TPA: PDZ domain-containing protein [Gemmatimonadales bacterium]|nr:PDZ domain-containing protein [Gemmatimonadales bacterium]